jgi:hypothetical protein
MVSLWRTKKARFANCGKLEHLERLSVCVLGSGECVGLHGGVVTPNGKEINYGRVVVANTPGLFRMWGR